MHCVLPVKPKTLFFITLPAAYKFSTKWKLKFSSQVCVNYIQPKWRRLNVRWPLTKKHICKEKLTSYAILILYRYYKQMWARKQICKKMYITYWVRYLLCDSEVTSLHTFSPNSPILFTTPICFLTILWIFGIYLQAHTTSQPRTKCHLHHHENLRSHTVQTSYLTSN
jgi:hypothetical protein